MIINFRHRPLKQKLSLIILLTSGILLLLATTATVTSEIFSFRRSLIAEMFTMADLIGINTAASVIFNTQDTAAENMAGLRANTHIITAHIFAKDGSIFASYGKEPPPLSPPLEAVTDKTLNDFYPLSPTAENHKIKEGYFFRNHHLEIFKPIYFNRKMVGTIYLQSDLTALWERLFMAVEITATVLLVSLLLGILISSKLQQLVTAPIYHLLKIMEAVSTQGDYSLRANKPGNDEIGKLIDGFNQMLEQIQDYREHLEEKVKQRTLDLAKARDQALAANKTKSLFLANISHEIRTPLNAVLGYTQLLQLDTNLTREQQESLQIIGQAGDHLLELINDILDISKAEAGAIELHPDNFYLNELLNEITAMFKANFELKHLQWHLENQLPQPDMIVYGDVGKLRQILINLIGNAVKFTDYGEIKLRVTQQDEYCQFKVSDTGSGMSPDILANIFKPFYQGTSGMAQGGTGLGLTISKQQVEFMGGTLTVTSELGKGSEFTVNLPLPKVKADIILSPATHHERFRLTPESKVVALVAEEKKDNRLLLTAMLHQVGVEVHEALNGAECLEEIQAQSPHLVFLSMQLPLINSAEVVRRLRVDLNRASLPCVAIVGSPAEGKHVLAMGFNGFLQTPFRLVDLHNCLDQLLSVEFEYPEMTTAVEHDDFASDELTATAVSTEAATLTSIQLSAQSTIEKPSTTVINQFSRYESDLTNLSKSVENFVNFEVAINLKGATVLMVDDTPENLKVLRKVLEKDGYKVFFASDGPSAIKITENLLPDLILLDIMMPIMDGFETCRILKQQEATKQIPIIFLTAKHQTEDIVEAFSAGAVDLVNKPFRQEEVRMRVRTHLQTHLLTKQQERFLILATKAQRIAEQARVAAEAANRAKSTFLAKMSHELRTPLNAILGYTELLQEEVEEAGYEDILPDLYKIQTAGQSLLGIMSDILDLAKIEADKIDLHPTEFLVSQLVIDLVTTLEPLMNEHNTLVTDCPETVGMMTTDRHKVFQILLNLLNNANKFTQHGTVTLRVARRVLPVSKAPYSQEWLIFLVIDTGIGITLEHIEKIFDAFSQADDSYTRIYGGTGLGLTISQHFAQALGGGIYVSSEVGQGSIFCLQLPAQWSTNL